jgi:hypothetical protein
VILAPALPTRVMKARRESTCPICRGHVHVGQVIAKCGGMWMHARCLIGHRHAIDQLTHQEDT